MNRMEVIMTIKKVGAQFSRVMEAMNGEEFAAGYRQALSDMMKMFGKAPIDPDFDAEREAMLAHIKALTDENYFDVTLKTSQVLAPLFLSDSVSIDTLFKTA